MTGRSRRQATLPAALALLALALLSGRASAQSNTFQNTFEAYLMGASMSGTVGAGPISTEIDVPSSAIFENLKFGALLDYRGEAPTWAVVADVVYMNLGKAGTSDGGRVSVDVGAEEFIVDLVGAYRVSKAFEVLGGLRYTALSTTMTLYGPLDTREAKVDKSWVDPVVGGQAFLPLSDAFQLQLRGDIGGFGVGCTFTWQATVRVNWQVSRTVRVGIGYRWLDQDYETGSGSDTFKWNVLSQGPLVAAGLKF
jgi:hypothetical protein